MKFKEQFPSLKDKHMMNTVKDRKPVLSIFHDKLFSEEMIVRYCLDKENYRERVQEAQRVMRSDQGVKVVSEIFGKSFEEIAEMIHFYNKNCYDELITQRMKDKQRTREIIQKKIKLLSNTNKGVPEFNGAMIAAYEHLKEELVEL